MIESAVPTAPSRHVSGVSRVTHWRGLPIMVLAMLTTACVAISAPDSTAAANKRATQLWSNQAYNEKTTVLADTLFSSEEIFNGDRGGPQTPKQNVAGSFAAFPHMTRQST